MLAEIIGPDILIILVIVGLLFGSSQIPKLARSLGSAKREFEEGIAHQPDRTEQVASPAVTMTKAELEALVAERDRARNPQTSTTHPQ